MGRLLAASVMVLGLMSASATAGQVKASFQVGITIGEPGNQQTLKARKLTYTWGAAAISVRAAGYGDPVRLEAVSGFYWFLAEKNGRRYRVAVSKTSGKVVKVILA